MCVAILSLGGKPRPTLENMKLMEKGNNDGAGVGWYDPEIQLCRWIKGLDAEGVDRVLRETVPDETHALIHFRMASIGGKHPGLTHPFPLGNPPEGPDGHPVWEWDMALTGTAHEIMIHNGHWAGFDRYMPKQMPDGPWSDTRFVAFAMAEHPEILNLLGGKVAILNRYRPTLVGHGWELVDGCYYSNTYWKPRPAVSYFTGNNSYHYGYMDPDTNRWTYYADDAWDYDKWDKYRFKGATPSVMPERKTPKGNACSIVKADKPVEKSAKEQKKEERRKAHEKRRAESQARKDRYTRETEPLSVMRGDNFPRLHLGKDGKLLPGSTFGDGWVCTPLTGREEWQYDASFRPHQTNGDSGGEFRVSTPTAMLTMELDSRAEADFWFTLEPSDWPDIMDLCLEFNFAPDASWVKPKAPKAVSEAAEVQKALAAEQGKGN